MNNRPLSKILLATSLLTMSACIEITSNDASQKEGSFVNGEISGIQYKTASHSGVIDHNGHFQFHEGEIVSFYIGNIKIGEVEAKEHISILDLTSEDDAIDSAQILNRLRLLYTLDEDGDPSNGIQISSHIKGEAETVSINFDQSTVNFENDNNVNVFLADNSNTNLVSSDIALENYRNEILPKLIPGDLLLADTSLDLPEFPTAESLNTDKAKRSGCFACHALNKKVVGPAWIDVANRYQDQPEARKHLFLKVKQGGKGQWSEVTGGVPMPPYSPRVSDEDILELVDGILQLDENDIPASSNETEENSHPEPETETNTETDELPEIPTVEALDHVLAKRSGCFACHAIDRKVVGPVWIDVADYYRENEDAREYLFEKVKTGGKGNWTEVTGGVPMPPYSPRVKDEDILTLVDGILLLTEDDLPKTHEEAEEPMEPVTSNHQNMHHDSKELAEFPTVDRLNLELAKRSGCLACHAIDRRVVGPAWADVAKRYQDDPEGRIHLFTKVKTGGKGEWNEITGGVPMPPYSPRVPDDDILELVDGILLLLTNN